jgi:Tfp pilus assembly protein PilN
MRAVNLLPADAYAAKQRLPHAPIVLAATAPVLACALVYLGYSIEHSKVTDKRIALGVIQSQVASLSPSQALVDAAGRVADQRTARQVEVADALAKQMPWDIAFDQIGRVLPGNAWLTSVIAQSPTPVGGGAGSSPTQCTIQGYTSSQADVALVLQRLSLVPALTNVTLASSTESTVGTTPVVQFNITASLSLVRPS